jgi:tripartite-type tricarboxylate transporter receptor subunit TctC
MLTKKSTIRPWLLFATLLIVASSAYAKSITIVIPFSAGSATDQVWRTIHHHLNQELKKDELTLAVEYLPGAGGGLGPMNVVNRSEPALLFTSSSIALVPLVNASINLDVSSLNLVSYIGQIPMVLFSNPNHISSWSDLKSKCRNGSITYGNSGHGSMTATTGHAIYQYMMCQSTPIHYKSASQSIPDLVGGNIDTAIDHPTPLNINLLKDNKISALMVVCDRRIAALPDVPCSRELGINVDFANWQVVMSNSRVNQKDLRTIQLAIDKVLSDPKIKQQLIQLSVENIGWAAPHDFVINQQNRFQQLVSP